jgi:hypothetical protein
MALLNFGLSIHFALTSIHDQGVRFSGTQASKQHMHGGLIISLITAMCDSNAIEIK